MNLLESRQLVAAVASAAREGVISALKSLKPSEVTHVPAAPKFPPPFYSLTGSPTVKPASVHTSIVAQAAKPRSVAKAPTSRSPKHSFTHLVALTSPAAQSLSATAARAIPEPARSAVTRPSAPSAAALAAANTTLALRRGALTDHAAKPSDEAVERARQIVRQQHAADAAAATEKHRAASAVAQKILASGNHRGVRIP